MKSVGSRFKKSTVKKSSFTQDTYGIFTGKMIWYVECILKYCRGKSGERMDETNGRMLTTTEAG